MKRTTKKLLQLIDTITDNRLALGEMFKKDDPEFSEKNYNEAYSFVFFRKLLTEEDFFNEMWTLYMTEKEDEK